MFPYTRVFFLLPRHTLFQKKEYGAIYTRCDVSAARIHLRKIFYEDRSTRHEFLNGKKRVRLSFDCDATGLYSSSWRRTRVSRTHLPTKRLVSSINCPYDFFQMVNQITLIETLR
ncbi:hypothetical protein Y032_0127g1398 [Ancylostoma ceylanicum]|uniref:Uncharacterized protein n=1 Tax=Ancylostoma ceylanicum TaxID=53326 RepID=A0A016T876_9BILA|nr:hypothetical protein Y032_0127g1398 [Ancylostoma ceylanicum]